jgi:hypothetical protein
MILRYSRHKARAHQGLNLIKLLDNGREGKAAALATSDGSIPLSVCPRLSLAPLHSHQGGHITTAKPQYY